MIMRDVRYKKLTKSSAKASRFSLIFSFSDFPQHCARWDIPAVLRLYAFSAGWNCQGEKIDRIIL